MDFQKGDLVQLKSGGPTMTVKGVTTHIGVQVHCEWFSGTEVKSHPFSPESLKKAEATDDDSTK